MGAVVFWGHKRGFLVVIWVPYSFGDSDTKGDPDLEKTTPTVGRAGPSGPTFKKTAKAANPTPIT